MSNSKPLKRCKNIKTKKLKVTPEMTARSLSLLKLFNELHSLKSQKHDLQNPISASKIFPSLLSWVDKSLLPKENNKRMGHKTIVLKSV